MSFALAATILRQKEEYERDRIHTQSLKNPPAFVNAKPALSDVLRHLGVPFEEAEFVQSSQSKSIRIYDENGILVPGVKHERRQVVYSHVGCAVPACGIGEDGGYIGVIGNVAAQNANILADMFCICRWKTAKEWVIIGWIDEKKKIHCPSSKEEIVAAVGWMTYDAKARGIPKRSRKARSNPSSSTVTTEESQEPSGNNTSEAAPPSEAALPLEGVMFPNAALLLDSSSFQPSIEPCDLDLGNSDVPESSPVGQILDFDSPENLHFPQQDMDADFSPMSIETSYHFGLEAENGFSCQFPRVFENDNIPFSTDDSYGGDLQQQSYFGDAVDSDTFLFMSQDDDIYPSSGF